VSKRTGSDGGVRYQATVRIAAINEWL
jgi:hypothetical protein